MDDRTRRAGRAGRAGRRAGARRRRPATMCYLGSRPRRFFLERRAAPMAPSSAVAEWLGGAAMVLGMVSWGLVLALIAA